jgi:hypothetical protein
MEACELLIATCPVVDEEQLQTAESQRVIMAGGNSTGWPLLGYKAGRKASTTPYGVSSLQVSQAQCPRKTTFEHVSTLARWFDAHKLIAAECLLMAKRRSLIAGSLRQTVFGAAMVSSRQSLAGNVLAAAIKHQVIRGRHILSECSCDVFRENIPDYYVFHQTEFLKHKLPSPTTGIVPTSQTYIICLSEIYCQSNLTHSWRKERYIWHHNFLSSPLFSIHTMKVVLK